MEKTHKTRTFWDSNLPLTSKRARMILSDPEASKELMRAIRASRQPNPNIEDCYLNFSKEIIDKL